MNRSVCLLSVEAFSSKYMKTVRDGESSCTSTPPVYSRNIVFKWVEIVTHRELLIIQSLESKVDTILLNVKIGKVDLMMPEGSSYARLLLSTFYILPP